MMGANKVRPDPISLVIRKTSWVIPSGTPVRLQAKFADGTVIQLQGVGKDQSISIDISGDLLRAWTHAFTSNTSLQLLLGGNEAAWTFDLAGTSTVINAMGDCFRDHQITGVAPPFGISTTEASTSLPTTSATQPFGAALPVVAPPIQVQPVPLQPKQASMQEPARSIPLERTNTQTSSASPSGEQTIAKWNGTGNMQTRPFHVDGPWELQWTTVGGYFSATLHDASGGRDKLLANGTQAGSSSFYQPKGGDFYLEFGSSREWEARAVTVPVTQEVPAPPTVPVVPSTAGVGSPSRSAPEAAVATGGGQAAAPAAQLALIGAVETARRQYQSAQNDMAKGAARPGRAQALCKSLTSTAVNGWVGKVEILTTNGDGKGVISVDIGSGVHLKTWNNALSDIGDDTLIDPTSPVFKTALGLHTGEAVRFSATLVQSDTDCFKEASMSMSGSISTPEFIMHLKNIEPLE